MTHFAHATHYDTPQRTALGTRFRPGRVSVALTPRALARLQTLPDSYRLPDSRRLACTVIGNGAPTEGMRRIIGGLT